MAVSPNARALAELRKREWPAGVVEQTIPRTFIKRDLLNCIDIVAVSPDGILGIQVTSHTNHAARRTKILAEPRALKWIERGGLVEVWSYGKQGPRGKRKQWVLRAERIEADMFADNYVRIDETQAKEAAA